MSTSSNDTRVEVSALESEEQARRERLRRWLALTPRQRFEVLESRGRVLARLRAGNTPAR